MCLGDTGGAAADLFNYSVTGKLPVLGLPPLGRDAAYVLDASELIPMIVKEGNEQGGSTKPKLSFFLANYDLDGNVGVHHHCGNAFPQRQRLPRACRRVDEH